jgi:NifU-like protein involved in Fe-S cluster formation
MVCGDQLSFSIKIAGGKIKDIKFLSFGCASNIATASILTEKVKGLTVAQAKKFGWQQVVKELGGLPPQKVHCSILAVEGLQKVLKTYEKEHPVSLVSKVKSQPILKKK